MEDVKIQNSTNKLLQKAQTLSLDIEFQDLKYVPPGKEHKLLLKSINGKFFPGELNAILGPTGSGKTILLKVLAGYLMNGVKGKISVNGKPRRMNTFHKLSAYLMQEDLLQPHLTLNESITAVARLKLGNMSLQRKCAVITKALNVLGVEDCLETRVENLSGGERKRLSIALEMVSNPPVIFLDEPVSGLDTVAIRQCVNVLKKLANQGTTVICTVHQPSASTFKQFDQVYFIANGACVYNGSTTNMIPFLSSIGLNCPITYNPAEYIIETVQTNEDSVSLLSASIENGKINNRDFQTPLFVNNTLLYESSSQDAIFYKTNCLGTTEQEDMNFPTSFWLQFYVLFGRMMLQLGRNKLAICIQLFSHVFMGLSYGISFFGIGNDAKLATANFHYSMLLIFFFVYTYVMTLVLLFPPEVKLLKREYFNRWYGLKPYFLALSLRNVPLAMVLGFIFVLLTYSMSYQPLELYRFIRVTSVCFLTAFVCESAGLVLGSICSITTGSMAAIAIAAPGALLCFYGTGSNIAMGSFMKIVMSTNYIRCALVAVCLALFENRSPFECNDIYCHYRYPKRLLRDLGMANESYSIQILILIIHILILRLIAFVTLRCRLSPEFSQRVMYMKTRAIQCLKK